MKNQSNAEKDTVFAEERRSLIISILKKSKKVLVNELCQVLNVSAVTIRRDLTELEAKGFLKRTHGGAILTSKAAFEEITSKKEDKNIRQKQAIAEEAIKYIENGDTIALDTGTTSMAIAKKMAEVKKANITVITSDLKIAMFLEENTDVDVIILGGTVRKGYHCTIGPLADKGMKDLYVDKCFIATNGLTASKGLSTPNLGQAEVKRLMIEHSNQVIAVCCSEKIGRDALVSFSPIKAIQTIITDSGADFDELEILKNAGVDLVCVKA